MFNEKDSMYIGIALLYSRISKAERLKVGCCFVTGDYIEPPEGFLDSEEQDISKYLSTKPIF